MAQGGLRDSTYKYFTHRHRPQKFYGLSKIHRGHPSRPTVSSKAVVTYVLQRIGLHPPATASTFPSSRQEYLILCRPNQIHQVG